MLFVAVSLLAGILAVICGVVAVALRRRRRAISRAVVLVCGVNVTLAALCFWYACHLWREETDPNKVFEAAFDRKPGPSITNIVGVTGRYRDATGLEIQFSTDEATFRSLLPAKMEPFSGRGGFEQRWNDLKWLKPVDTNTHFFHRVDQLTDAHEERLMTWNPEVGLVQYFWLRID